MDELTDAVRVAVERNLQNIQNGRKHSYSAHDLPSRNAASWDNHINGAIGELCVAKALNRKWTGKPAVLYGAKNDVEGVEVRTTTYASGSLIVHKEDQDDAPYILVTGYGRAWTLRGWLLGRDAKKEQWYRDANKNERHAYFVPQAYLHGMDTLPRRPSDE